MLSLLVRKQLAEIFRSYFYNPKTNKKRSKGAVAAYLILFALLMVGLLGGMFTFLAYSICGPFLAAGMGWLYFALMTLIAVLLGTFGSVFNTFSGLYLAKDNDLLLSMPIPVGTVMAARLLGVYLMGLMYSGVVMLPAVIVYWIVAPFSAAALIGPLVLLILTSVFILTLSCALGWVVAKISLKLKNKSIVTTLTSLLLLGLYYFVYFKAQMAIQNLVTNAAIYGEKIKGAAYPVYLLGKAGAGDGMAMLLVAAVVLGLFALTWWLLARSFLKIATATGKTERAQYRERTAKGKSPDQALLGKEFARFTGSANYMLNCGLGILFLPVVGVLLLVKGGALFPVLETIFDGMSGCSVALTAAALCMSAAMIDPIAPSVSLEGKSLWLVQSLPVTAWQVLRAKLRVQLLLCGAPMALAVGCVLFVLPGSWVELGLLVLVAGGYVLLEALFGLTIGLKLPNLNWTSEITPIKQGASVAITMLAGWGYGIALGGLYFLFGWKIGLAAYLGIFAAASAAACAGLFLWLRSRGCRVFAAL